MRQTEGVAAGEDRERDLDRRRSVFDGQPGCVELEVQPDVEQARDVFGPLEVAAHPEEVFSDPAEHGPPSHATCCWGLPAETACRRLQAPRCPWCRRLASC